MKPSRMHQPAFTQRGIGLLTASLLLPLGFALGLVTNPKAFRPTSPSGHFVRQGGYRLVQPLLDYEVAKDMERTVHHLKQNVEALVNETLHRHDASHVSVYFRDLNNGPWFGIHEHEQFTPSSLFKVPVLMAYLKQAESDPHLLARQLAYSGGHQLPEPNLKPSKVIDEGTPYPVEELLARMIVHSDNRAGSALVAAIDLEAFSQTFTDLGIPHPNYQDPDARISVKRYATFFRILFNASYLSPEMSEKALDLLTKTEFRQGLVAGVPADVVVANKFGERATKGSSSKQLHDCGIVYCPRRPYLLCVMTRGDDVEKLIGTIREASRLVYEGVCQ